MEVIKSMVPGVIVFDVYETLIDMSRLERSINQLTDSKRGYILWLELFMEYCFVTNSLEVFQDFLSIARATLQIAGHKLGKGVSETDADDVLELLKHLPVHDEVQGCLSELRDDGYRLIGLTNAPEKVICERMERTGLISYFEKVLSAESVKRYKPAKEVYDWASNKIGVRPEQMLMVTAHSWDIAGASGAGMKTALIARSGKNVFPLFPRPDIICNQLPQLVSKLKRSNEK
jgi:2-haloacid dehalogenase